MAMACPSCLPLLTERFMHMLRVLHTLAIVACQVEAQLHLFLDTSLAPFAYGEPLCTCILL